MEIRTRSGRQVKLTRRMQDHLRSMEESEAVKMRLGLIQNLQILTEKAQQELDNLKDDYIQVTEDISKLKTLEQKETKDLSAENSQHYHEFYKEETEQIQYAEETLKDLFNQEELQPQDSISVTSRASARSRKSTSSRASKNEEKLVEELSKQVELEARKEAMLQQVKIDAEKQKLAHMQQEIAQKEQLLRLETELEISRKKLEVLSKLEEDKHSRISRASRSYASSSRKISRDKKQEDKPKVQSTHLNPPRHESTHRDHGSGSSLKNSDEKADRYEYLLEKMTEALIRSNRNTSTIDPDVFTGNILEYEDWRRSFEELVENDVKPERRIVYLKRYTSGAAKECVSNLQHLESVPAYLKAMEALEERYRDPYRVYEAVR